jgi:hypothetical protein
MEDGESARRTKRVAERGHVMGRVRNIAAHAPIAGGSCMEDTTSTEKDAGRESLARLN